MAKGATKIILTAGTFAALAGCGGATGGAGSPATEFPVDSAEIAFFETNHNYTLNASGGGNNYTLALTYTAVPGIASFDGQSTLSYTLHEVLTENGSILKTIDQTDYFFGGPYEEVGAQFSGSSSMAIKDSSQKPLPQVTTAGTQGNFDAQTYYQDGSFSTVIGTGSRTWSLTDLGNFKAQFCLHDTDDLGAGGATETETDCQTMDDRGNVTALQITATINGVQLVFQ